MFRLTLYIMAGITTALLGWTISQIIMYLLDWLAIVPFIGVISTLRQWPEVITIPTMTVSLAVGMVLNEIIISNPTRPSVSFKKSLIPLVLSILIGLLVRVVYASGCAGGGRRGGCTSDTVSSNFWGF